MRSSLLRPFLFALSALPLSGVLANGQVTRTALVGVPRVLIYSGTSGYRHDSIPTAIRVLKENQDLIGVTFDNTEDAYAFTDENLAQYDGLVFLSTTEDALGDEGLQALQNYFDAGGNFVGIHSASACVHNNTFYLRQLGAGFHYHAALQPATVKVSQTPNGVHPSVQGLDAEWVVNDEMYYFKSDPRESGAVVVLEADDTSFVNTGVTVYDHGDPHPIAWYQEAAGGVSQGGTPGRSFYTSLGHLNETWEDPKFFNHVLWGIWWSVQSNTTRASNLAATLGNPERVEIPWEVEEEDGTELEEPANDGERILWSGMQVVFASVVASTVLFAL